MEPYIAFEKELSVIVARDMYGHLAVYPVVENIYDKGVLQETVVPAAINSVVAKEAQDIAVRVADALKLYGVLVVEFFLTSAGDLLVNELTPRPHASGYWTTDACLTGQFEQMIRAICGLPLGDADLFAPARMVTFTGSRAEAEWALYAKQPRGKLHYYGDSNASSGRERVMGHVTVLDAIHKRVAPDSETGF